MVRKTSVLVVVFCALLTACGGKTPTSPTGSIDDRWGWPDGANPPPDPNAEHYASGDGLVDLYVHSITPGRNNAVIPGQKAEIRFQEIYTGTEPLVIFATIVDDPDQNPGKPGRSSQIFNGGLFLKSADNKDVILGTFLAPVAEDIPYIRLCGYYNGVESKGKNFATWCNINIQVGWHP